MKVLSVKPNETPVVIEMENTLENLQKAVGGCIEVAYPFEDLVGLVVNEEGKIQGLPLNRGLFTPDGELYDIVAGNFLVVGLGEDDFCSLTDEQEKKFMDYFYNPEMFVRVNGELMALPIAK